MAGLSTSSNKTFANESQIHDLGSNKHRHQIVLPDWENMYHKTDDLIVELRALDSTCDAMSLHSARFQSSGRSAETIAALFSSSAESQSVLQRLTVRFGLRKTLRVLASFGEHGRELITTEAAMYIIRKLCNVVDAKDANSSEIGINEGEESNVEEKKEKESMLDSILPKLLKKVSWNEILRDDVELLIVPMVNTEGRRKAERGDLCSRLNEAGVDLNRNYPFRWGQHDETTVLDEEKPGPSALSEPESRAIDHFVRHFRPHVFINVHSGDQALLFPYDSGTPSSATIIQQFATTSNHSGADSREEPLLNERNSLTSVTGRRRLSSYASDNLQQSSGTSYYDSVLNRVRAVAFAAAKAGCSGKNGCSVGDAFSVLGYRAFGTAVDYVFHTLQVPFAYTVEIYGDLNTPINGDDNECFELFNPSNRLAYRHAMERAAKTIAAIVEGVNLRLNEEKQHGSMVLPGDDLIVKAYSSSNTESQNGVVVENGEEIEDENESGDDNGLDLSEDMIGMRVRKDVDRRRRDAQLKQVKAVIQPEEITTMESSSRLNNPMSMMVMFLTVFTVVAVYVRLYVITPKRLKRYHKHDNRSKER
eukprot:CAMPEP_0182446210 /NCGR_PEP_ID=MMETSP1172-20130603/4058_1 /TAXON_ID=708627 /ORGANISM="Timspurckia oligopyrenoides, Strain CCMP3278" /LENGTH=590 /DNA_ID=CAMNT_0024642105 /DNA_START=203 /DNA_END=1975 /DNA_ORIENTATION=-